MLLLLTACAPENTVNKRDDAAGIDDSGPPSAPEVSILPASPRTGDELSVQIDVPAVDPDGDEVFYAYVWSVDGALVGGDLTIAPSATTRGEVWTVEVTARDAESDGGTGTASTTIENTPPVATDVSLEPTIAYTNDMLVATAAGTDDDDDPVTFSYAWYVDGAVVVGTDATLDGTTSFARDQEVYVEVTPDDGTDDGAPLASQAIVIANTPPTAPGVSIEPGLPGPGDDLLCGVDTPSSDADGDLVSYAYAWDVDGSAFGTGDSVAGAEVDVGETWTCTVTPDDGTDTGPTGSASVTVGEGNFALRFDGVDDYVSVPDAATLDTDGRSWTVEAWVWWDTVATICMATVRKGTASTNTYDYWLHKNIAPGDSLFWGSAPGWSLVPFSAITDLRWTHYAGVYDAAAGEARVYIDGILIDSGVATAGTPNSDELRIGNDWDFGCPMLGVIDEVRISAVARYSADFSPSVTFVPDADTMALWHFDENTGTVAGDASGNGNDGTVHGAAWTSEHP